MDKLKIAIKLWREDIYNGNILIADNWKEIGKDKNNVPKWQNDNTGEQRIQQTKPLQNSTNKPEENKDTNDSKEKRKDDIAKDVVKKIKDTPTQKSLNDFSDDEKKDLAENITKSIIDGIGKKTKKEFFTKDELSLPKNVQQPKVHTKEDFYKQAKEAEGMMFDWLDRGTGIDREIGAKHFDLSREGVGEKLSESLKTEKGPILITAPLKGEERAKEKVDADYGGDWSKLTDGVRATLAVDSFSDIDGVFEVLRKSGMKLAKKPKDRFANPTEAGYRDTMMNVEYPNGHIGELQVHVKPMLVAKDTAHKLYEKARSITAKAMIEKREAMTDDEQKQVDELNNEMKNIYGDAWKQANGGKTNG